MNIRKKVELDETKTFVTIVLPVDEAKMLRNLLNHVLLKSLYNDEADLRTGLTYDLTKTLEEIQ
jgi:hypothetical protein